MARRRYSKKQVAEALEKSGGIIEAAARLMKCHRHTVLRYIDRYPELERVRSDAWESILDVARVETVKLIREGHPPTLRWLLSCSGDPCFTPRHRFEGKDGGPIEMEHSVKVEFYLPDNGRDAR